MSALLDVSGIDKRFGGLHAVDEVSFALERGSVQAVIGPNGAGKTTLFNLIAGAIPPDGGKIEMEGRDITGLPPHKIARLGILRTFQAVKLSPRMSALDNVMLGLHAGTKAGFFQGMLALPPSLREERMIRERAMAALEAAGIERFAREEAGSLPFGTQRMVELARALAGEPALVLLDEPASGLNMRETRELSAKIRALADKGITVLLVEHDMSLVMEISDRVVVLNFGKKIAEGSPKEVQSDPEVVRIYLGDEDA
jgi:branched-chain amino acid transport system ATP-binding protein